MGVEEAMAIIVEVPIALLYGSWICGGLFFLLLNGLGGIIHMIIEKTIDKIREKKKNGTSNN